MRTDGSRADAQDNRKQLIGFVGQLLAAQGTFTLSELADRAGVSRSTTYRNFSTPQDAIDAFIEDFLTDWEQRLAADPSTEQLVKLGHLCCAWGQLVEERGHALVHVRSTEGFLTRAHGGDPIIGRIHRSVHAVIADAVGNGDLPGLDPDYGVFLWNLILDPRELLDLATHRGQTVPEATEQLTDELLALLHRQATDTS